MCYTDIYSDYTVYQKYIGTSINVRCATRSLENKFPTILNV